MKKCFEKFIRFILIVDLIILPLAQSAQIMDNQKSNRIDEHLMRSSDQCSFIDQVLVDQELPSFDQDCEIVLIQNVSLTFKIPPKDKQGIILILQNKAIEIQNLIISVQYQNDDDDDDISQMNYVDLNITFENSLKITDSTFAGLRFMICESNSNYEDSIFTLNNVIMQSIRTLFQAGHIDISSSSKISSTEYFCKTQACTCKKQFNQSFTDYEKDSAVYLSFLQDYNETNQVFDITATVDRYGFTSLIDLLQNNVFTNIPMRVQLLIFTYYEINISNTSSVEASNIAIYSQNLSLSSASSISTTGRGCSSSVGLGCGLYDTTLGLYQCGGSGASHGGQGGNPISVNYIDDISCNEIESRPLYGNPFNPIFEGSGGGSDDDMPIPMSSGGGVIYIESIIQVTITGNSTIESNGTGTDDKDFNNGGGAGGSIQLHTALLRGNQSTIMANGGFANTSGGSGSGGRVKLNFTDWMNATLWVESSYDSNLFVTVNSGLASEQALNLKFTKSNKKLPYATKPTDSTGQSGSIITTPCPQTFESVAGYKCQICQAGYYKSFSGWSSCTACPSQPKNSYYTNTTITQKACSYKCLDSFTSEGGQCLDSSQYFVYKVGGWEVIIPVITFLLCLASLVLARLLDNRKRKRSVSYFKLQQAMYNNNTSQNANMYDMQIFQYESQKRPDFHVEDLPYHMKRVYLHGENTHKKPWKINSEDDEFEMEELAMIFNEMSKYTKLQTRILWIFKLIYIVSYFWASRYMKTIKLIQLKKLIRDHQVIKKHYEGEEDQDQYKFKLSTSEDLTLAFIDIFNYNKSVLNWQNKTSFPVCLVLAGKGSFISPFHLYVDDPLCKSLQFTFQQQDQIDIDEESDTVIIKFENFLKEFNSLAKLIDYSTREKTFLENFSKLVKYVDKQNKKFFQEYGIEADICIHKLVRDKFVSQNDPSKIFSYNQINLQSRIIMLSYKDAGELISCLKDTHYLKNYSRFYEIKISLNFYIINKVIHNDQVEIKTDHNINKQIQTYINYDQNDEEVNHLRIKVMKKNYEESNIRDEAFIPKYEQIDYYQNQNESVIEDNRCLWLVLLFFYLRRIFGVFKSSFLAYRQTQMSVNFLGVLMLITMIIHFVSVICTFISFFLDSNGDYSYRNTEMYIIIFVYPFCFAISPLIMIVWLVKHTERIGKVFMLFNYNAFYTYIIIMIFGLIDVVRTQESIHILVGIAKIIGVVTTWIMSYLGSGYILLQEMN